LIQTLIGIAAGAILGWALKTVTDAWTWRRQQVLDAHLAVLEAADLASMAAAALWSGGSQIKRRDKSWLERATQARHDLAALDRASGRLRLVGSRKTAEAALDLYIATEVLFRHAISVPATSEDEYQPAGNDMARIYDSFIETGRRELALQRFSERLSRRPSIYELSVRRMEQLNETHPVPRAGTARYVADDDSKP
jgi:hypothetical protein